MYPSIRLFAEGYFSATADEDLEEIYRRIAYFNLGLLSDEVVGQDRR